MRVIKNCTPHPIVVQTAEGKATFPPTGIIPRVGTVETEALPVEGLTGAFYPCITQRMGTVEGLPPIEEDTLLIVSAMVFGASDRVDLIAPDTGKGAVRDGQGRILAVTRFIRKEV